MARMRVLRVCRKPHTVFFKYRKLRKNRPREQNFDAWRTLAEVNAGSARFFIIPGRNCEVHPSYVKGQTTISLCCRIAETIAGNPRKPQVLVGA